MKTYTKNAKWAFTINEEFKKSVVLDPDEKIVYKRRILIYSGHFLARTTLFVLTNKRVVFLKHYFFLPDKVVSVALEDIKSVKIRKSSLLATICMFRKYEYIKLDYISPQSGRDNSVRFFAHTPNFGQYWKPSGTATRNLYNKISSRIHK